MVQGFPFASGEVGRGDLLIRGVARFTCNRIKTKTFLALRRASIAVAVNL
jgi:hypothetical protein